MEGIDDRRLAGLLTKALAATDGSPADAPPEQGLRGTARCAARELFASEEPERLARSGPRYDSPLVARHLTRHARRLARSAPEESLRWAELAVTIAEGSSLTLWGAELIDDTRLYARAARAEALRAGGELDAAADAMDAVLSERHRITAPQILADVHTLAGALCRDRGRAREGLGHLARARGILEELGDERRLGRVLLRLAALRREDGDLPQALEDARRAAAALEAADDAYGVLCAHHNLAAYLCDADDAVGAHHQLEMAEPLYQAFATAEVRHRAAWLRARLAEVFGDLEDAERGYLGVRRSFLEADLPYDAALVSLDLAALYIDAGRFAELRSLATWMSMVFSSQQIRREALAAIELFRDAASAPDDQLSLRELTVSLDSARQEIRPSARVAS